MKSIEQYGRTFKYCDHFGSMTFTADGCSDGIHTVILDRYPSKQSATGFYSLFIPQSRAENAYLLAKAILEANGEIVKGIA